MNSSMVLNFETRPHKFTERKMLLASLQKICNYFRSKYQYIGFGGLTFTDFKLFHKELHIDDLYSIEGGKISFERILFNAPYSFIKINKNTSTSALSELDLSKITLVWLDYDEGLDNYMFTDIGLLFGKLPAGSIYIMTCNRELKNSETREEYTTEQFKNMFNGLVPFEIENQDFSSTKNFKTIGNMLNYHISSIINERNSIEEKQIKFHQLYNILYEENRGARMFTFGGVITNNEFDINNLNLESFDFIFKENEHYEIKIPNLTRKEMLLIDNHLFEKEDELLSKNIVSQKELVLYKEVYKYMPHFYDIRI